MNYVTISHTSTEKITGNFFNFVSYITIDSNYNKSFKQREIKIQKYFDLFVIFTDSVKFNLF